MENIRNEIIERISEIGAGESLLIFTTNQDTFIKFEAKLNGQLHMTGHDGETSVHLAREFISRVVEDFSVVDQIKELPLKTVKLNADGQFQVDDDPDTFLATDKDGIADRSMVPLGHQVKDLVKNILPDLGDGLDLQGDGSFLFYELKNGFDFTTTILEDANILIIKALRDDVTEEQIDNLLPFLEIRILPFLVQFSVNRDEGKLEGIEFRIELPAPPLIGQHLSLAITALADAMNLWLDINGGEIEQ